MNTNPVNARLADDETKANAICCSEPRSNAPATGPTQLSTPPTNAMARALTE